MTFPPSFPLDDESHKRDTTLFGFPIIAPSTSTVSHKQRQLDAIASAYAPPNRSAPNAPTTRIDFFHRNAPRQPSLHSTSDTIVTRKTASVIKCQDARLDLSPLSMLFEAIMADVDGDEKEKAGGEVDRESFLWIDAVSNRCSVDTTGTSDVAMPNGSFGWVGMKRGWEGDLFPCSPGHTDTSSVMLSNMSRSLVHNIGRIQAYRSSREVAYRSSRINTLRVTQSTTPAASNRKSDLQAFPYTLRLSPTTSALHPSNIFDPVTPRPEESLPLLHSPTVSSTLSTATFPTLLPLTPSSPITDIGTMLDSTLTSLLAHHSQFSPPPILPGEDSLLFSSFPSARGASTSQPERQAHESGIVDTNHFQFASLPRDSFGTVWDPSPPPTATAVDQRMKVSPPRPTRPLHCRDTLEDLTVFTESSNVFQSPCLKSIRKAPREYLRLDAEGRESAEDVQQVAKEKDGVDKEKNEFKLAPAPPAIPRKASSRKCAAKSGKRGEKGVAAVKASGGVPEVEAGERRGADEGCWRSSALSVQTFVSALSDLDTVDYNDVPLYTHRSRENERGEPVKSETKWVHEPVQLRDEPMEVLNTIALPSQSPPLRRPPYKQPRCQPPKLPPPQLAKKPSLIRKLSASLRSSPRTTTKDVHVGGATDYSKLPTGLPPTSIVNALPPPLSAPPTRRPTINVVHSTPSLSTLPPSTTTSSRKRSFSHSSPSPPLRLRNPSSSSTPPSTTKTRPLASTSTSPAAVMVALKPSLKRNPSLSSTGTTHTSASHSSRLKRKPSRTTIVGSASKCVVEFKVKKSVTFGGVVRIASDEGEVVEKDGGEMVKEGQKEDGELRDILCGGRRIGLAPGEVIESEWKEKQIGGGAGMEPGYVASLKGLLGSFTGVIGGWRRSPS